MLQQTQTKGKQQQQKKWFADSQGLPKKMYSEEREREREGGESERIAKFHFHYLL